VRHGPFRNFVVFLPTWSSGCRLGIEQASKRGLREGSPLKRTSIHGLSHSSPRSALTQTTPITHSGTVQTLLSFKHRVSNHGVVATPKSISLVKKVIENMECPTGQYPSRHFPAGDIPPFPSARGNITLLFPKTIPFPISCNCGSRGGRPGMHSFDDDRTVMLGPQIIRLFQRSNLESVS